MSAVGPITFPSSALEIKADWLRSDSLSPGFDCDSNKPAGVYVEKINGKCYALVGIFSSKLKTNWVWATFEPQNTQTNPNRCNPQLYSPLRGSVGLEPVHQ